MLTVSVPQFYVIKRLIEQTSIVKNDATALTGILNDTAVKLLEICVKKSSRCSMNCEGLEALTQVMQATAFMHWYVCKPLSIDTCIHVVFLFVPEFGASVVHTMMCNLGHSIMFARIQICV